MLRRYNPAQIKTGDRSLFFSKRDQSTFEHLFIRRGFERPQSQHRGHRSRNANIMRFDKFLAPKQPHRVRRA